MIGKAYLLVPLALTAGFVSGFGGRHFREGSSPAAATQPDAQAPAGRAQSAEASSPSLKSAGTVESLLELDDRLLYQRLALWTLDADEGELGAFLERYQKQEEPDEEVLRLLFARWTKLDPAGALKAAKAAGREEAAWWAWAMNDPEAAAREVTEEYFDDVVEALARFHPGQVAPTLAAHPEFSVSSDVEGVAQDLAVTDPGGALQLLRAHNGEYDTEVIGKWTKQDPHSVLAWLEEHPDRVQGSFEEGFLNALKKEHPELLAELAARARSGQLKWLLEGAAFQHLATTDPAAALAMAEAMESPRVKAERLTVLGRGSIAADPRQALARLEEVFRTLPDAANRTNYIGYPDESESVDGGVPIDGLEDFARDLVAADARGAMEVAGRLGQQAGELVANHWVSEDLDGFSTWLLEQSSGPIRDYGAAVVVRQLTDSAEFPEAIAWTSEISEPAGRAVARSRVISRWSSADPENARAWVDGTALSSEDREVLNQFLGQQ